MPRLPPKPNGYRSEILGQMIDYMQSITPLPTPEHRLEFVPQGVFIRNKTNDQQQLTIPDYRFQIKKVDDDSVKVLQGSWTRNGTKVNLTCDTDKSYKTLTSFAASKTYYVELALSHTGGTNFFPYIIPTNLDVSLVETLSQSLSPSSQPIPVYFPIGSFQTDTNAKLIANSIVQWWNGGDINDFLTWPDGELDDTPTTHLSKSLHFRGDSQKSRWALEINGWYAATASGAAITGDLFIIRDGTAAGHPPRYLSPTEVSNTVTHDDTSGAGDSSVHDAHNDGLYWRQGGVFDSTCYGQTIGRGLTALTATKAIDLIGSGLWGSTKLTLSFADGGDGVNFVGDTVSWDSNPGVTIAGWTRKGGVIGTQVIEIAYGDIDPRDKVLVRRTW